VTNDCLLLIVKFVGLNAHKTLFFSSNIVRNYNHDAFFLVLSLRVIYLLSERAKINKRINNI